MVEFLLHRNTDLVIGLFPRHMERIGAWQQLLTRKKIPFILRSQLTEAVDHSTVILWDTIGELQEGYSRANATFVGGSLAPLGGQNFLEPLAAGLQPVIGKFWSNFYWVGEKIFKNNLVIRVNTWQEAADVLLNNLNDQPDPEKIRELFVQYAERYRGGTRTACAEIHRLLALN